MLIKTPNGPWIRGDDVMLITSPELMGTSGTIHSVQIHFKTNGNEGTKYTFTFESIKLAKEWIDEVVSRINQQH